MTQPASGLWEDIVEKHSEGPSGSDGLLDLGILLGQNHALGVVAGRCSAAQASAIRRLREERHYERATLRWKEFCPRYLNMSDSQANRIVALLDEFGPGYFTLAQLTRVSPETFRAIAPAVGERCTSIVTELQDLLIPGEVRVDWEPLRETLSRL